VGAIRDARTAGVRPARTPVVVEERSMKFSLRVTLLSIMLLLVGFTVAGLGFNSYWNASSVADDLSKQILEETSLRIDSQINELLLTANRQGELMRRLLEAGQFASDDFATFAPYWLQQLKVHPRLTRLSLGLEADGQWYYARRLVGEELAIGELRRSPESGKLELRDYLPDAYPGSPFIVACDQDGEDPRSRPWYRAARAAGKQIWSETYVLFGI